MKKRRWKYWPLLAALLVVFALLAGVMGSGSRDAEWYAEYVRRNEAALLQIARGELDPNRSLQAKRMLARGKIEQIAAAENQTRFFIESNMLEGHVLLVYAPEGNVPTCLDFYDNWVSEGTENGVCKWTGGMAGKAYILLYDLGNGFYLEEAYLPT